MNPNTKRRVNPILRTILQTVNQMDGQNEESNKLRSDISKEQYPQRKNSNSNPYFDFENGAFGTGRVIENSSRSNRQDRVQGSHNSTSLQLKQLIKSQEKGFQQMTNALNKMTRSIDKMAKQLGKISNRLFKQSSIQNVEQADVPENAELVKGDYSESDQKQPRKEHMKATISQTQLCKMVKDYWIKNRCLRYQDISNRRDFQKIFSEHRVSGKKTGLIWSYRHFSRKVNEWKEQQERKQRRKRK